MRVVVAGGTGVVGRHVVAAAEAAGHEVAVLSRQNGVDLISGQGLDDAMLGARAVIDVSNVATLSRRRAVEFFTAATRHLLEAGQRAGVTHHVALSIVGCDRVDFGYYFGKRAQEELVLAPGVPGTVLRATQFHEFAGQLLARSPGPVAFVPRMRSQPVAASEVAEALVELASAGPAGLPPELAGPEVHEMVDLARRVAAAQGASKRVVGVRPPGAAAKAMANGGLLPSGPGPRGAQTFGEWLRTEFPG